MAEAAGDDVSRREFEALRKWRDEAVNHGRVKLGLLKDSHLRGIVGYGRKDVRVIRGMLSPEAQPFADKMAEVLADVNRPSSAATASSGPLSGAPGQPPSSGPTSNSETSRSSAQPSGPPTAPRPQTVPPPTSTPTTGGRERLKPGPDSAGIGEQLEREIARFVPTRRIARPQPVPLKLIDLGHALRLRWAADPGPEPFTIFRVVSGDGYPPLSPEGGQLVGLTRESKVEDLRPPVSARRYYQVYSYSGPSEEEMYEAQPALISSNVHVFGVQGASLEEDEGRVIGRWRSLPGVDRVHVFRVPLEHAHLAEPHDEQFRLNTEDNLVGFVDKSAARGGRYRYDFYVETTVDDQPRLSEVVSVEHAVTASLTRVTDLQVERRFDEQRSVSFDLSWSRPAAGEVHIFRTESGPLAGATHEVHSVEALPQTKLESEFLLKLPVVDLGDGREGVRDVPGRETWSRIYLTPVTVLDGRARVGDTVTQLVVGAPIQPEIVERCDYQVLKFGWPSGAAKVVAVVRAIDDPLGVPQRHERSEEIDEATYRGLGGLQFRATLPADGCAVHLAGQAFEAGRADFGLPVSVVYPGLLRMGYSIEARQRRWRLDRVVVRLWAEQEFAPAPPFVLVYRPDRLPLYADDGETLEVSLDLDTVTASSRLLQPERLGPTATPVGWSAGVRGLTGYVRLFVDTSQGRFALLDPPASSLVVRP